MKNILILFLFMSSTIYGKEIKYDLAICAIFQDDSKYIPEWIEFHLEQGVQHFYLYNNLSSDDYMNQLYKYVKGGLVTLVDWPYPSLKQDDWNIIQCDAYMDCIEKTRKSCKWVAFLDTDEFLFSPKGYKLPFILPFYSNYGGVSVNWVIYGTGFVDKINPGEKMIEKLLYRAPMDFLNNLVVKSIVQPKYVIDCAIPHVFIYTLGKYAVSEEMQLFQGSSTDHTSVELLRINHYCHRDREFYWNVKVKRLKKWIQCDDEILKIAENSNNNEFDDILCHPRGIHSSVGMGKF